MSEKRFTLEQWTKDILYFSDGEYSAHMSIGYICKKVEKKLNEQQATIEQLESDKAIAEDYANIFEKENVKLRKKNKEQQATINELQSIINHIKCEENCEDYDYCCETVCSLYNEIKHLKEENEQLKEEIEPLKQKEEVLNKIWRTYLENDE